MFRLALVSVLAMIAWGCASTDKAADKGMANKVATADATSFEPQWAMKADIIEACSCPMFCQCYLTPSGGPRRARGPRRRPFLQFNNAYKISKGNWAQLRSMGPSSGSREIWRDFSKDRWIGGADV